MTCGARPAFVQRDGDVVVANRDAIFVFELLLESERALEPSCALLRVTHGEPEMTHDTDDERVGWICALGVFVQLISV